jgi:hypothetical protein
VLRWLRTRQVRLLRAYHGWATLFWAVMVPVSIVTGLWRRIEYVTFLSIWALVSTEWGAYQASRAEVKVDEADSVDVGHADRVTVDDERR